MLQTAAALSLPALVPARILGLEAAAPPSETVRVGVIGCGGRAGVIGEAAGVKGFRVVAACDCQLQKAKNFAKAHSPTAPWPAYADFRQMIDKEKLDGVMIETTTHARAWIAMLAMQAGMDVYIEKPMCLTIAEGREMVRAARKLKPRDPGGHAAALDADQQLGQRPGKERRHRQGPYGARAELRRPGALDEDLVEGRPTTRSSPGGTCGRTRPCCGPTTATCTTAGAAGGTMTAAGCASA